MNAPLLAAPALAGVPVIETERLVLRAPGPQDADAFVASTDGDNTNIVIAQVAKQRYEVPVVAARILDPARADFYSGRGFDVVSPTKTAIGALSESVLSASKS